MATKRSIGSTAGWALGVSLLGLISGTTIGAPVADGAGTPDDLYYIPPGYFAPGVPAVGTLEQQQMMADAVDAMWALGDEKRQEVIDFGDQAVIDLDALIASGAEPWDVYDAAVELEEDIDALALANQLTIAGSVVPIFGDVESSLPAPPTELLTAAFGPTLTSISLLWVEADYYVLEFQSRRPETRPAEPAPPVVVAAPPVVVAAAPAVVFEPEPTPATPSVESAEVEDESASPDEGQPSTVYVSPHERKRLAKLEKKRQKQLEKERKQALKEERKREKQLEKQRKKELKAEAKRQKQIEKRQKRAEKLEAKRIRKLQRQQRKARGE